MKINRTRALEVIAHRGPDGEGQYESLCGAVWLGSKRLAIIDPERGRQPIGNEDGSIQVVFNGCIYNYLELAQTLRRSGHVFKSYSDTEVIVHAYEEWGRQCVNRFNGMFAFALWDDSEKRLFCARDRLGVKPLYYWSDGQTFAFASEIKALIAMGLFRPEVCDDALQEYITFQAPLREKTLFQQVRRCLPGHVLMVDRHGQVLLDEQYWDLRFDIDFENTEDYFVDHLQLLLRDAVKIQTRSDVALGAHLSGGVDSSTIVCLASDQSGIDEQLKTFTGAFHDSPAFDETAYAAVVSQSTGCRNIVTWPTADDFRNHIQKIIYYMDEPAAGPGVFPQYMVARTASEHVKVVLGGQGGDEIFAGYARYLIGYLEECLRGAIEETGQDRAYAATLGSIIPSLPMLKEYTPLLQYFWSQGLFGSQEERYHRLMDRSGGSGGLYHTDVFRHSDVIRERFDSIFNASDAASFLNRMVYFDCKVHLQALLHVEDRTSMAWGLESRVPLLDHRIVEFVASIPPIVKFKNGHPKHILRQAIKNIVPSEIMQRKDKMGFPVPLQDWFKGPLKGFVKEILLDTRTRQRGIFNASKLETAIEQENDFGRAIWGALCLELWFQTFIDNPKQL